MKTILIVFTILLSTTNWSAQTKFTHNDIIGYWDLKDQYQIRIEEHTATLGNIYNPKFPAILKNNIFYHSINHNGDNT